MTPVTRVGLLHVPALDLATGEAVRRVLAAELGTVAFMQENYAAGQRHWIEDVLVRWCDEEELDLLLTIGGTLPAPGPSGREIVPEATAAVLERGLPGLAEAMRQAAQDDEPLAWIDRGVAGIRGRTLILNLPEGRAAAPFLSGVVDLLEPVLAHLRDDPAAPRLGEHTATDDAAPEAPPARAKGLDAGEFAAFLQRRKEKSAAEDVSRKGAKMPRKDKEE
jgi:molybdopterin biosynthesis enzyme MoaB